MQVNVTRVCANEYEVVDCETEEAIGLIVCSGGQPRVSSVVIVCEVPEDEVLVVNGPT